MSRRPSISVFMALLAALGTGAGAAPPGADEEAPDPGTTFLAGETVGIAFDAASGRPLIDLRIEGRGPYRFVVDTGAGMSVVDAGIARGLGLEVVGSQVLRSPGAVEEIVGERVRAARLEAGGLTIASPELATMDLAAFSAGALDGVLGRPHFAGLLLVFDYPRSMLVVSRGSLDRSDPAVVEFDIEDGSIRFPVDAAGVAVPMVLDTGSPGGFTVPKALESRLPLGGAPAAGPTIRLVGGVHSTWRATLAGTIRLADLEYESPEIVLSGISDEFGNLGNEILRELRVTLDQASGLVRFERGAAVPEAAERRGPVALGGPTGKPRLGVAFEMTLTGFVKERGGIVVRHVDAGSPAATAGVAIGDVVTSIAGTSLASASGLFEIGGLLRGPRPLALEVLRGGETLEITIE